MGLMRDRVQNQFPMVLLTLLSIVQALALELLWEQFRETKDLLGLNRDAILEWLQILVTLMGIILIWVAYASNAMRFRWVPTTADSVYPFLIGLLEFIQIENLGSDKVGKWAVIMAVIFAAMVLVSHFTMRRARLSGDNGDFFEHTSPATLRDFVPHILLILILLIGGWYSWQVSSTHLFDLGLVGVVFMVLVWQYISSTLFWNTSMQR